MERAGLLPRVVLAERQRYVERQNARRVQPRLHLTQVHEAADHEPRAGKEHEGERHLRDDETAAQRSLAARPRAATSLLATSPCPRSRRNSGIAPKIAPITAASRRKRNRLPAERHRREPRNVLRRDGEQRPQAGGGHDHPGNRRAPAQQQALREIVRRHVRPVRAEDRANRRLAPARIHSHDEQVRHVGDGDQQHEDHRAEERPQRFGIVGPSTASFSGLTSPRKLYCFMNRGEYTCGRMSEVVSSTSVISRLASADRDPGFEPRDADVGMIDCRTARLDAP